MKNAHPTRKNDFCGMGRIARPVLLRARDSMNGSTQLATGQSFSPTPDSRLPTPYFHKRLNKEAPPHGRGLV